MKLFYIIPHYFYIYIILNTTTMPKFPMADGREFTNFLPSCELNNQIQKKYDVKDGHQYRYFLQQNAEKIIKDMADCANKQDCKMCPVCKSALEWKPDSST